LKTVQAIFKQSMHTSVWAVEHAGPVCACCCIHQLLLSGLLYNAVGITQRKDSPARSKQQHMFAQVSPCLECLGYVSTYVQQLLLSGLLNNAVGISQHKMALHGQSNNSTRQTMLMFNNERSLTKHEKAFKHEN
jgi:hypothetical protein